MPQRLQTLRKAPQRAREPLYKGLFQAVRRRIELGQLQPGSQAPSESELIAEFRVSSTTARRCLNDLQLAGYVERIQGKGSFVCAPPALVHGQQIGLLYNELFNLADVFLSHLLRGIGGALQGLDGHPTLLASGMVRNSSNAAAALMELVERHELQGLMIVSPIPQTWLSEVLDRGLPVVSINFGYDDPRIASVTIDQAPAYSRIINRLKENGHQRVLSITRTFPSELLSGVRLAKWSELSARSELEWRCEEFRYFQPDQTRRIVTRHLETEHPPTAIITWGYELALEAREAVKDHGRAIPGDVSLIFLGVPAGPTDLSGEIVPVDELGGWAARYVLEQIRTGRAPVQRTHTISSRRHEGITLARASR
jgi:DNA-binding LacI/PurR family transcriptional regulator